MKTSKNLQYEDSVNGKQVFFNPKKGRLVTLGRDKSNRPQRGNKPYYA